MVIPPDLEPRIPGGAQQGTGDRRQDHGDEEKGCEEDHQEEGCEEVTRFQDNSGRSWKGPVVTPALFFLPVKMPAVNTTRIRRRHRSFALAASLALVLFAQLDAVRAEDALPALRTGGLLRVHLDYPTKVSVGFGVIAARIPANFECKTSCLFHGMTLQGAAGLGGGELAIGYGSLVGETGHGDWLLRRVSIGYGVRAAVLRTWGDSPIDPHGGTFLGVEGEGAVAQFGVRLGVFRRVDPVYGERDWRVFGGAGWSF